MPITLKRKFEVVMPNGRTIAHMVRGICQNDLLNPCWDNRPTDIPGKHWGGPEVDACPACTAAALVALGAAGVKVEAAGVSQ